MPTVKLCTHTRGFYPTIWGYKVFTVIGIFLVIVDGKIIKRSFSEFGYTQGGEFRGEFDAMRAGLDWIVNNVKNLRDTNLQVFFCGSKRTECKRIVDAGEPFPAGGLAMEWEKVVQSGISDFLPKFNKVEYSTASRVMINNGENDDPESEEKFNLYEMSGKIFDLLYGDSGFKHEIVSEVEDEGITRKVLVGQPEIRWQDGQPKGMWEWS